MLIFWKNLVEWYRKPFCDLQITVYIQKHRLFKKYRLKIHYWKMFDDFCLHDSIIYKKLELESEFDKDREIIIGDFL